MPAPRTDAEAETAMHLARTAAESISLKARAYSHQWLRERQLPSQLPDELRPRAERMFPTVTPAVGIAVVAFSPALKPVAAEIEAAMSAAVEECYAAGETGHDVVRARMLEAKDKTMKALLGKR